MKKYLESIHRWKEGREKEERRWGPGRGRKGRMGEAEKKEKEENREAGREGEEGKQHCQEMLFNPIK